MRVLVTGTVKTIVKKILHAGAISFLAVTATVVSIEAQPPLTINGEAFQVSVTGGMHDIGSLALQGNCAAFPATFQFQASGLASSALNPNGTFSESGYFTIAAGAMPGTFVMTAFQASYSFPITNPPGQVTGSKSLNPAGLNQVFSCDANLLNFNVTTTYTAQIVTPGGTFVDQGTANVILGDALSQPSNYSFSETFLSTGSRVETCVAPPSNMLGWWPGDGTTNDLQGGNNGMWVGTAAYAPGEVGSAFSFDGSSYVTVGNPSSLNLTGNQVTLDGWINPSAAKNDVVYFGKTAYGENDYVLIFQFNEVTAMIKTSAAGEVILGSSLVPPLNQWTHLAFTYDGTTMNLYANGALISTGTTSGNLVADSPEFAIGGRAIDPFGRGFRFPGLIDEVEVFNRALSASEIQAIYAAGSAGKCKSPQQQPTTLSFTAASATTADFDDAAQVQARLTNSNTPVAGKTITFTLGSGGGAPSCSAMTDATGTATCSLTPNQAAGSYTLMASFSGDSSFGPSSASTPFTVTKEETLTKFTLTSPTVVGNGGSATFSATLKEDGLSPVAGRTLTFTLGSGSGSQSCSGTTNGSGTAACAISVNQPLGPNTVKASFAGDGFYQPSSDMEAVIVFGFPGGGAGGSFVIGDLNAIAGNTVKFWGAQWASLNSLSGGPAPNAFKGFANQTSTPAACGGSWTTGPGNSSKPPDSVPSYMAVIASSSIGKSGATISGNIARIVVINTNPGYGANPGHAGTGTVVAVLPCH